MSAAAGERGGAPTALMDRIYRHQRFIYDLTRKYYLFGRDRLIAELDADRGAVLEIGCGTGRNLVAIARRFPQARLYGIDISAMMLATAATTLRRRRLEGRIATALADATDFDPEACLDRRTFDRILFSYTLSMIPEWGAALRQAARRLAPGGRLMIVDFGQLDGYPALARRALFAWLGAFHVHPIEGLALALADLARREGLSLRVEHPYRGYAVYAVLERPVDLG